MSSPRARFQRLAWTFALAAAVLLKAAVPFLAAGAAAAQGLPVGEICSVYGVRTAAIPPAPDQGDQHADHGLLAHAAPADAPAHGPHEGPSSLSQQHGQHCALGALGAFAPAPPPAVPALAPEPMAPRLAQAAAAEAARDAPARWSALRKQGPPPAG